MVSLISLRTRLTSLTVRKAILKVEGSRAEYFTAVGTGETLRMELLTNGIQTILREIKRG